MAPNQHIEDCAAMASFLVWLEHDKPTAMWGGRKISDVVNAAARMMRIDPVQLREAFLLDSAKAGDDRHD